MIRVNDLCFTYAKAKEEAVRSLSFDIESGEIFGFLGPSGATRPWSNVIVDM